MGTNSKYMVNNNNKDNNDNHMIMSLTKPNWIQNQAFYRQLQLGHGGPL